MTTKQMSHPAIWHEWKNKLRAENLQHNKYQKWLVESEISILCACEQQQELRTVTDSDRAHTLSHLTVLELALTLTLGSYCNSLSLLGAIVYELPDCKPMLHEMVNCHDAKLSNIFFFLLCRSTTKMFSKNKIWCTVSGICYFSN